MIAVRHVTLLLVFAACKQEAVLNAPTPKDDPKSGDTGNAFALTASITTPLRYDVSRGQSKSYTIGVDRLSTFSGLEILATLRGAPSGVTLSGGIAVEQLEGSVTLQASLDATLGAIDCTLRLQGGNTTVDIPMVLTVLDVGQKLGVSFTAPPSDASFDQDGTESLVLDFTRANDATGAASFSVSGLPTGVTATFDPTPASGTTTLLTLADDGTALPGESDIVVHASIEGFSDTILQVHLTVRPLQTLNVTVVDLGAPLQGVAVLVDGVMSPASDGSGHTTITRAVPRDSAYTLAVLRDVSGKPTVALYQDLTRHDPIVTPARLSPGAVSTGFIAIGAKTVDGSAALVSVSTNADASASRVYSAYRAVDSSGETLAADDLSIHSYGDAGVGASPAWAPGYRAPFGTNSNVLSYSSILVPDGNTMFDLFLQMVMILGTNRAGGAPAISDGYGNWRPLSYLYFGELTKNDIPDVDEIYSNESILTTAVAGADTVSATFDIPPAHTFDSIGLYFSSVTQGWTMEVVDDCYDTDISTSCDQTLTQGFDALPDITFNVPAHSGPSEYQAIRATGRMRVRRGKDESWATYRVAGNPHLSPPVAPALSAPANGATDVPKTTELAFSRGGYANTVFIVVMLNGNYTLTCYTASDSCRLPAWLADTPSTALPSASFSWLVSTPNVHTTVDALTATSPPKASLYTRAFNGGVDVATDSVTYSGTTDLRSLTFAP